MLSSHSCFVTVIALAFLPLPPGNRHLLPAWLITDIFYLSSIPPDPPKPDNSFEVRRSEIPSTPPCCPPSNRSDNNSGMRHSEALKGLFTQVLRICKCQELVKPGAVALGGTKVKANASLERNRTYEKLEKEKRELDALVE